MSPSQDTVLSTGMCSQTQPCMISMNRPLSVFQHCCFFKLRAKLAGQKNVRRKHTTRQSKHTQVRHDTCEYCTGSSHSGVYTPQLEGSESGSRQRNSRGSKEAQYYVIQGDKSTGTARDCEDSNVKNKIHLRRQ